MAQKRRLSTQSILEWAFRVEHAGLELPEAFEVQLGRGYGTNSLQRFERLERLGCFIDGGGKSDPHEDAEVVAAIVSNMPDDLGGPRAAVYVAEHARAALSPDWMPGAVPRLVPKAWRQRNQLGQRAATERVGVYVEEKSVPHPRNPARRILRKKRTDILVCPCTWEPEPRQIDAARKAYAHWVDCLADIRDRLQASRALRDHEVSDALPPREPWLSRATPADAGHRPAAE